MKELKIYRYEIIPAQPPFPYLTMDNEAFKKWTIKKLIDAKFDLKKTIFKIYALEEDSFIYFQK